MNDITEGIMYKSDKILEKDNRICENENNDDGDKYVDKINRREYEMIYLMDKSDYDDKFFITCRGVKIDRMED